MASVRQWVPNTKMRIKVCLWYLDEFKWILPLWHFMINHTLYSSSDSLSTCRSPQDHPQNSEMVLCCMPQGWCW